MQVKDAMPRSRDLPQDVAPPRDLWPQIAAQLTPSAQTASTDCDAGAFFGPAHRAHALARRRGGGGLPRGGHVDRPQPPAVRPKVEGGAPTVSTARYTPALPQPGCGVCS